MKHPLKSWLVAAAMCASLSAAPAPLQRAWPAVTLPDDVRSFEVGDELGVNGMPMRIRGFLSARSTREVAQWFRARLAGPVVESHLGNKLILGQQRGGFYVTVQLEQVGSGTRGLVSTADIAAAAQGRDAAEAQRQHWLGRLPAGTRILSRVSSQDGPRLSSQLVYSNGSSEELNSQALKALLREDGLRLEHEARGRVLLFKGGGKEATAVIVRLPDGGGTSVVLNTVTTMETLQ